MFGFRSRRAAALLAPLTVALAALIAPVPTAGTAHAAPLTPVGSLDIDRYLGQWWQLATVPSFFGLRCARDTYAVYTLVDESTIGVRNRCTSPTGTVDGVDGRAAVLDPATNAQLAVTFPQVPVSVNPGDRPNYVVTYVESGDNPDDPYRYALVGNPSRTSGFLLSRSKVVDNAEYLRLRGVIERAGFDSCTFLVSPTTGGRTDYSPLCLL